MKVCMHENVAYKSDAHLEEKKRMESHLSHDCTCMHFPTQSFKYKDEVIMVADGLEDYMI